jgi:aldehyde dehydrogenase (NAD+)
MSSEQEAAAGLGVNTMKKIDLPEYMLLINGQWVAAASGKRFGTYNPASGELIAMIAEADEADVNRAVEAARVALSGPWGQMSAAERGRVLNRMAALLRENADEFATLECLDAGKPISAVQRQDVPAAIDTLEYYAGWADKVTGEVIPARADALTYTVREPVGVVAAIVPWNSAEKMCPQGVGELVKKTSSDKGFNPLACAA